MTEAPDDAPIDRALIDAARPGLGPSEVQRMRLKKGVLAAAAASAAAGGAAAASGTGASTAAGVGVGAKVAVSLVGLVAIGGGMWLATRSPERPRERHRPTVAEVAAREDGIREVPTEVAPPLETAPVPTPSAVQEPAQEPAPDGAESSPEETPPLRPDPRVFASIERETELIREAHLALRGGDAARAMTLLEAHESQAPRGALSTERRVLRILCLCELGEEERARREAERFIATGPSAALVARVEASCVGHRE